MKKFLLSAIFFLALAAATRIEAQTPAPNSEQEATKPSRTVVVTGAVKKPGVFPLLPGEKVTSLLERAGGAKVVASFSKVYVLRDGVKIPLDLSQDFTAKFILHEGDVLVVPENMRRVYVVGNVAQPGVFPLPEKKGFSVMDALNSAGGILSPQSKVRIGVLRANSDFSIEWHDWPKKADDPLFRSSLKDGDGIYVQHVRPKSGFQLLDNS